MTVEAATDLTLLVDVGSGWTKGAVVGQVRGRWRVAAAIAQPTRWGESALLEGLVGRLAPHADPRLASQLAAHIADASRFVCRSLRQPGRLAVAGADPQTADRAAVVASAAGWEVLETGASGDGRMASDRLAALIGAEPDAWLLAGDGAPGSDGLREAAGLIQAADGGRGRPILTTGAVSGEIRDMLRLPAPPENGAGAQPLRAMLDAQLLETEGITSPRWWTSSALERTVTALALATRRDILAVDIGVQWATWVAATAAGESGRTVRPLDLAVTDDLPDGELAAQLAAISHQVPDEQSVQDHLANAAARPGTLPQTPAEAAVALAVRRAQLSRLRRQAGGCPPVDLVIGSGRAIAGLRHPAEAALALLDAVRPAGVVQLALDGAGVLSALGALPDDDVEVGLMTLLPDVLVPLGTAVVTRGGRPGQPAMRATLHRVGWPDVGPVDVRAGSVTTMALGPGERGELAIELLGGATLGGLRGSRLRSEVSGGALGVILDTRDDPIQLPTRPGDRRAVLGGWRDALRRDLAPDPEIAG